MPVDENELENLLSDEDYENWATVSEGFGSKIEWQVGTVFVGEFTGVETIESDKFAEPVDAMYFRDSAGERHYSWLTHQLREAVETGAIKPGNVLRIECKKEEHSKTNPTQAPVKVFEIRVKPGT